MATDNNELLNNPAQLSRSPPEREDGKGENNNPTQRRTPHNHELPLSILKEGPSSEGTPSGGQAMGETRKETSTFSDGSHPPNTSNDSGSSIHAQMVECDVENRVKSLTEAAATDNPPVSAVFNEKESITKLGAGQRSVNAADDVLDSSTVQSVSCDKLETVVKDQETIERSSNSQVKADGSGTFRVHTLPSKLIASIKSHEMVSAWPKLKAAIGQKIWGAERYEPVPTIIDGAVDRFDLGSVLMKTRLSPGEKWRVLYPRCQALGSIYDLIWHTDMSVDAAVEMAAPLRVDDGAPWPNHRFHGLAFKDGYCRQVAVTVSGCHRSVTRAIPAPDSLVLNLYRYSGRYRTDKIYVVTDVIYAEELHVTVRVSINKDDVKILHRVPIAFRLHVYNVRDLTTLIRGRPYQKPLKVRWMGLADANLPSTYPRKSRGMGDVTKRTSDVTRPAGLELLPNRHRRGQLQVDFGGDRPERIGAD